MLEKRRDPGKGTPIAIALLILVCFFIPLLFLGDTPEAETECITLYGFSVKGEVLEDRIFPAFKKHWEEITGKSMKFKATFAGSGKITNQVIAGAPAEVMILSTEWDALELKRSGRVATDWRTFPKNGTVSMSPWIIMTRKGNPKGITDFHDLTKDDVEIIHADPLTSGGARWSIFSIYGSELIKTSQTEGAPNTTAAEDLLSRVVGNVISWQSSARKALSQFELGYGDALITYECEALLIASKGGDYEIIYPQSTIFSEHKVVIVDANVNEDERDLVEAFVEFLHTVEAQGYFADYGFRSVYDALNSRYPKFKEIEMPFTVEYLNGWEAAQSELIEDLYIRLRD